MGIVSDIAERRIFRFVVGYGAAGWAVLEVIDQLVNNEIFPLIVYRAVLALFVCGIPGALIVSWFHGAKGRQAVSRVEAGLLGIVSVFALVVTGFVVRAGVEPGAVGGSDLAPTEDPRRVAVLYFEPRGGDDAEFLASGLTETLIDRLSPIKALHVISKNGVQMFRNTTASPDSIGRALQAGSLVGGTVQVAGDRVRVDVELTGASDGERFAGTRIERPRSEIFALQDELADTVAVFLRRAIGVELEARSARAGTQSVRAWELLQQGEQEAAGATVLVQSGDLQGAERNLQRADSLLAQAEAADPAWAEPVVRRGWLAYRRSRLGGLDRSGYLHWIGEGLTHARRALEIQPANASALELQGTLTYWKYLLNLAGTPDEADQLFHDSERDFRAAIAESPSTAASAQNSLSHLLLNKGETAEAKLNALQAYTADPFLENANLTIFRIFISSWSLGDAVEAERYCDEGMRRYPDDYRFKQCELMMFALPGQDVDIPRAWQLADEFAHASPPQVEEANRARGLMYVSMALARAGLADSARAVAVRGRAPATVDPLRETALLESITRTWLGDIDEAVRQISNWLAGNPANAESLRQDAARGELAWYHQELLQEPRFRALVGLQ